MSNNEKGKRKALLIGVTEYGDGFDNLEAPEEDIKIMEDVLGNPDIGNFQVTSLLNPDLTEMRQDIQDFFYDCQEEDTVLFYFSGHSYRDIDDFYLLNKNSSKKNRHFNIASSLEASFIHRIMDNCVSQRQIIILDCCYSGAFGESNKGEVKNGSYPEIGKELSGEGRAIITSSKSIEISLESKSSNLSVYTRHLAAGLQIDKSDKQDEINITVGELHKYVEEKVRQETPYMTPQRFITGSAEDIIIATIPNQTPQERYGKIVRSYGYLVTEKFYVLKMLDVIAKELGLEIDEARKIKNQIINPYLERIRGITKKKTAYQEVFREGIPNEKMSNMLPIMKGFQEFLGLTNEDVEGIHQKENERQKNLKKYKNKCIEIIEEEETDFVSLTPKSIEFLKICQKSWDLTDEDVEKIVREINSKIKLKQEYKKRYEVILSRESENKNRLSQDTKKLLLTIQEQGKLSSDDVREIRGKYVDSQDDSIPASDKPASDKPASDEPASDEPASDEPASDDQEIKPSLIKRAVIRVSTIAVGLLALALALQYISEQIVPEKIPPSKFATRYCQNIESLDSDTKHTVKVLLETVDIDDCQKAAAQLVKLNNLSLDRKNIVDISPLSYLTNLKELDLENNPIKNIKPLSLLKNLQRLNLRRNKIQDLTPISQLKGLNDLNLSSNGLEDLSNIEFTEKLEQLRLENNYIKDITPLASLKQLKLLDISKNRIEDITKLSDLDNLETLYLNNNAIKNIQVLENMRDLEYLDLSKNKLGRGSLETNNQLEYLQPLTDLTYLNLDDNNIIDLSPLRSLDHLRYLKVSRNKVKNLSPLVNMKKLKNLILFDNQITNINPLVELTTIEELYLTNNQIKNIAILKTLKNLKTLDVRNNPIPINEQICPIGKSSSDDEICDF